MYGCILAVGRSTVALVENEFARRKPSKWTYYIMQTRWKVILTLIADAARFENLDMCRAPPGKV